MKKLLMELCDLHGVSGYENEVWRFIYERIKDDADEIELDHIGNLIAFKKGKNRRKRPVIVCAHTDEVGYLVRQVTDSGILKIGEVGGVDPRISVGARMVVGENKIPGIIALKAFHLTREEEREIAPKEWELSLDIGAKSREEALSMVSIGDQVTFANKSCEFGIDCVKAKAIDDRGGCAVMMEMLKDEHDYDTYYVFTTNEEILRGALPLTRKLDPGACLVLEGTSAVDMPDVAPHMRSVCLRGGAAISAMDRFTIYNREFREKILRIADEQGIKYQYRAMDIGGTDSAYLHCEASGALTLGVSIPCRNMHTGVLICHMPDVEAVLAISRIFVKETGECDV